MAGNFATRWNPIFKPPCFLQDFLNHPRKHLQNSKSGQAKKVYKLCYCRVTKLRRRYIHPHASRFDDKKVIFLAKFIKIHIKAPSKFVCKWISLLIPRSLNSKLTVNLKNFIKFHKSYKKCNQPFFQKKKVHNPFVRSVNVESKDVLPWEVCSDTKMKLKKFFVCTRTRVLHE